MQHAAVCSRDEGRASPGRGLSRSASAQISVLPAFRSGHPGPDPHVDPHLA